MRSRLTISNTIVCTDFKKGFTLIETIVGVAVFAVVAMAAYQAYVSLFAITSANQYKILALGLANEQFEIVRNMPYSDIGIVNGIPNGKIPYQQSLERGGVTFSVTATVRNIDLPADGTIGGTPHDLSPADNKMVSLEVTCASCVNFNPIELTTTIAPKNLETASTNGALSIKVFDANGVVVQGADVTVTNINTTPNTIVHDVTDSAGLLQIVDAATGTNAYRISVTKDGYSTDRTYPLGGSGNPTPSKPDSTVLLQQVTPISFEIDKTSTVSVQSLTATCSAVPSMDFTMTGSKMIGTNVPKYSQSLTTNGSGLLTINGMEWDSYTIVGNDSAYDIVGLSPLNPVQINPDTTQSVSIIVAPKNTKTLLVTVKDGSTQLPLSDATVTLSGNSYTNTQTTGRGYISQTDWSGGAGQNSSVDETKFYAQDGGINFNSPVGDISLAQSFGSYVASGVLESSIFDTGSASNFHNLFWTPVDQPVGAGAGSVRFQIATNATSTASSTWNYLGPDGTNGTYYDSPGLTIAAAHSGDRYLRYKAYLSSANGTSTPTVSDLSFTFTSSCTPPGQVVFGGLTAGTYTLTVSRSGYVTQDIQVTVSSNWAEQTVLLTP